MLLIHWQWSAAVDWIASRMRINRNDSMIPAVFAILALAVGAAGLASLLDLGHETAFISGKHVMSKQAVWVEVFKPSAQVKVGMTVVSCQPFSLFIGEQEIPAQTLLPEEARLTTCHTPEAYGFSTSDLAPGRWAWNAHAKVILAADNEVAVRWGRAVFFQLARLIVALLATIAALALFSHGMWERRMQARRRTEELNTAIQKSRAEFK